MTAKQLQAILILAERDRKRKLKDQLAIQFLALRGDPKEIQKILK